MICLSCGDCCKRMSPLTSSETEVCPQLQSEQRVYYCGEYGNRPTQCYKHDFPAYVCPVGKSVLKIQTEEELKDRVALVREVIACYA